MSDRSHGSDTENERKSYPIRHPPFTPNTWKAHWEPLEAATEAVGLFTQRLTKPLVLISKATYNLSHKPCWLNQVGELMLESEHEWKLTGSSSLLSVWWLGRSTCVIDPKWPSQLYPATTGRSLIGSKWTSSTKTLLTWHCWSGRCVKHPVRESLNPTETCKPGHLRWCQHAIQQHVVFPTEHNNNKVVGHCFCVTGLHIWLILSVCVRLRWIRARGNMMIESRTLHCVIHSPSHHFSSAGLWQLVCIAMPSDSWSGIKTICHNQWTLNRHKKALYLSL